VLDTIRKTARLHQAFIEGTMVSSFERNGQALPTGKAVKTAPFWRLPILLVY